MGLLSSIGKLVGKVAGPVATLAGQPWLGAAISAGTSLLGGAIERNDSKKAVAAQNEYNDPAAVRARYEAAGLNPTLMFGSSIGTQTALSGGGLGTGVANAGALVADEISRNSFREKQNLDLQKQNEELKKRLSDSILRPKVAGVYGTVTPDKPTFKNKIAQASVGDPDFIGPDRGVRVQNILNEKWMYIPRSLGGQLDLKDGDWWTPEHTEGVAGDVFSEGLNAGALATGAATGKGLVTGSIFMDEETTKQSVKDAQSREARQRFQKLGRGINIPNNFSY